MGAIRLALGARGKSRRKAGRERFQVVGWGHLRWAAPETGRRQRGHQRRGLYHVDGAKSKGEVNSRNSQISPQSWTIGEVNMFKMFSVRRAWP